MNLGRIYGVKPVKYNTIHYNETTGPPIHRKPRRLNSELYEAMKMNFSLGWIKTFASHLNPNGSYFSLLIQKEFVI